MVKKLIAVVILLFLAPAPAHAEGIFTDKAELKSGTFERFLDASDDASCAVSIDSSSEGYDRNITYYEHSSGVWTSQVVASNGIKQSFPLMETHPVISGDGKTIVFLGKSEDGMRLYEVSKREDGTLSSPRIIESVPDGWFGTGIDINYSGDLVVYVCGNGDGWFGGTATLYYIEKISGAWTSPKPVFNASGSNYQGASASPSLDKWGDSIAWAQSSYQSDVFYAKRTSDGFSEPQILTSTPENETLVSLSRDGNTVSYIREYTENSVYTGKDICAAKNVSGEWKPEQTINPSRETISAIYDSKPTMNESGTRLVYNSFLMSGDTITHARLKMSQYENGNWTTPVEISDTSWLYDEDPNLSEDGKKLIFPSSSSVYTMTTSIAPPEGYVPSEDDSQFAIWPEKTGVISNKKWTVTFSSPIDDTTATTSNVIVKDSLFNPVFVSVQISGDKRTLTVEPDSAYSAGKTYYLYIMQGLKSSDGETLKKPLRMKFTIIK